MASKNIVAKGTTYNGVESVTFPVSGGGNATFYEISDTTAVAADVDSSKWFYTALGVLTQGTASGGGGGSTGLVYESGTYTPSEDTAQPTISFTNAHTSRPFSIVMSDTTASLADADSNLYWIIASWYDAYNGTFNSTASTTRYGVVRYNYKTSSGVSAGESNISSLDGNVASAMSYHMTSSEFKPFAGNASRYWRAGRTYKWIAVWAPTT